VVAREVIEPNPNSSIMTKTTIEWKVHSPGNLDGNHEAVEDIYKSIEIFGVLVSNNDRYKSVGFSDNKLKPL
jgi:hypothetical protein